MWAKEENVGLYRGFLLFFPFNLISMSAVVQQFFSVEFIVIGDKNNCHMVPNIRPIHVPIHSKITSCIRSAPLPERFITKPLIAAYGQFWHSNIVYFVYKLKWSPLQSACTCTQSKQYCCVKITLESPLEFQWIISLGEAERMPLVIFAPSP